MNNLFDIKICGITDEACMKIAIDYKIDYIGLVFYEKSPRNVTIPLSKKLLDKRNKKTKIVALTVNPDDMFLQQIKNYIKPDYIQLHGEETPNRCKNIRDKFNIPLIKGIGIKKNMDLKGCINPYMEICDILILDAPSEELPGGNGKKFNWKILKNFKSRKKWMLAGGLNINNISEAIHIAKPPAIDISSGLEKDKGIKDPQLIKDFIFKCRNL